MLLLVGLGNPGREHAANRHNVGFMAVDEIHRQCGFSAYKKRFHGLFAEGHLGRHKALALKPMTYMNRSGAAVSEAASFYKIAPADTVVWHDELDLAAGKVRVKVGGGTAGHNGLASIDAHLGRDYRRVRVGIGRPPAGQDVIGWVLRDFSAADNAWLELLLAALAEAAPLLADRDDAGFMTKVARLAPPPKPPAPAAEA
jgi:peptidyl-tRNA hydrolase, PTH1 family